MNNNLFLSKYTSVGLPMNGKAKRFCNALLAAAIGAVLIQPAKADDCATMLKPVFDFIKQPGIWDVPPAVYATVTWHYASGWNTEKWQDPVRYSNGGVQYGSLWWSSKGIGYFADTLYGTINMVQNIDRFKDNNPDLFAPRKPPLTLKLYVSSSGVISVQELVGGKSPNGAPPQVFQASCSSGLLSVVDKYNSWAISFTTTVPYNIK